MFDQKRLEAVANQMAKELRMEREQKQLSMTAVAERAGLSQQMISYVERGMRSPTLDTLLRICAALRISLGEAVQRAERNVARKVK